MTLARPRRNFLALIWQGFSLAGRFFRSAHLRVMARKQARLMAQPTITVAVQPIAPQPQPIVIQPIKVPSSPLTPTEQETLQVSEQVSCQMVGQIDLSYETQDTQDDETGQPELTRRQLIEALLDEAWGCGLKTYPQLITYVEEQSGTGCSRRAIAAWKKERGLVA